MQHILTLNMPESLAPDRVGGKFASLAALSKIGIRVPYAVAIPTDLYNTLAKPVADAFNLERWEVISPSERKALVTAIQEAILSSCNLPEQFVDSLRQLLATNCPSGVYAVRSSATHEDSATASFAGQMDTYLNIHSDQIEQHIKKCWASLWSLRAIDYRQRKSIPHQAVAMCVIVQEMVLSEASGVIFTTDPLTQDRDAVVIEAVIGLGTSLVDGSVVADHYSLQVSDIGSGKLVSVVPGSKTHISEVHSESSGIRQRVASSEERDRLVLTEIQAIELAETAKKIERFFGQPQDVEWALYKAEFKILQARPITAVKAQNLAIDGDIVRWTANKRVLRIGLETKADIPQLLQKNDKVQLRLIAAAHNLPISPGWLIHITEDGKLPLSEELVELQKCGQLSMVLLHPARFEGRVYRQFAVGASLVDAMTKFVQEVNAIYKEFTFIITEIYTPRLSGIAKVVGEAVVTEIAYGSYIPKGVAATSLYILGQDGTIQTEHLALQSEAVYIVDGSSKKVLVQDTPSLTQDQLSSVFHLTQVIQEVFPAVTVEYAVDINAQLFLIDIIKEGTHDAIDLSNINIISPGRILGRALRVTDDETMWKSLEAHFHSNREFTVATDVQNMVIVASRPFLALEDYLSQVPADKIGFVFEQGSILGHFAIILREYAIPAVIEPRVFAAVSSGDIIEIDSSLNEADRVKITRKVK